MLRKANPNNQYKVSIHINNGYRYASTQPFVIDSDTSKKTITTSIGVPWMIPTNSFQERITSCFLSQNVPGLFSHSPEI